MNVKHIRNDCHLNFTVGCPACMLELERDTENLFENKSFESGIFPRQETTPHAQIIERDGKQYIKMRVSADIRALIIVGILFGLALWVAIK